MSFPRLSLFTLLITFVAGVPMSTSSFAQERADWVVRSDKNAEVLFEIFTRFNPEGAGQLGIDGLDEEVQTIPLDLSERSIRAFEGAIAELESRRKREEHTAVAQDLEILIDAARDNIQGMRLNDKYMLPTFDMAATVFQGLRALLDDQIPEQRRPAALTRLKRYAGMEDGYTPITEQAMAYTRARFDNKDLLGPFKDELERDMSNAPRYIEGIEQLFQQYGIEGYEEAYGKLKEQLSTYEGFLRDEIVPRTREDFRLPPAMYAYALGQYGIDMSVEELVSRAKVSFREIQNEMQTLAVLIARERGLADSDYRSVIRELKKEQLGEGILEHYQGRIADLEALIKEYDVITLPERDMRIRLASEAESAAIPAPSMRPPRLVGNTGEMGEFLLPLRIPGDDGEDIQFDDFTFAAASWTLTVHEGRPGHELQFASIIEKGVSQARIMFAFNSVNVEGWALYQEAEMKPLMPLEGQLISLQHRLLRAARAYLDPGLQSGVITQDEAYRILENEVVVSHGMALQEVERYTFRAPGQATSYFCGYTRLMELRTDTERLMGEDFKRRDYHDFILTQGLLPPRLLREAIMGGFVPPEKLARE
jgi:uncharacterized protein (DUF885 family)